MARVYDKKIISKAKRLYSKGVSLRKICKETGIKSTSTVQFHCDPEYRAKAYRSGKMWRKKNPKRWRDICKKAVRKQRKNSI
jgi:hypothetical protein